VEGSNGTMQAPDVPPSREPTRRVETGAPGGMDRDGPRAPRPLVLEVGREIDDFLLLDSLGEGAFARVFLAHQTSLRRTVALKVSETRTEEAQTLAQLDHPHIVRVYDQRDTADGSLDLLYMEYVPGGTLEAVIDAVRTVPASERSGALLLSVIDRTLATRGAEPHRDSLLRLQLAAATWPETVCLVGEHLATALSYAHTRGVQHRDVKPANVLLDETGCAKLADFNISWSSEVGQAGAGAHMGGSLPYMSPEQLAVVSPFEDAKAEDLDGRSDIYALGVLLWELLTGDLPLAEPAPGLGWEATFAHLLRTRRAGIGRDTPAALPPDTPALLVDTLRACLAPAPEDRPVDGAVLARRFRICLDPELRTLLTPATRGWTAWVRTFPIVTLLLLALAPNAILSGLAILYNVNAVVAEDERPAFLEQLTVVNGIGFPIGILLMLALTWPIHRAVRRAERGEALDGEERRVARKWALRLGGGLTAIILPLWILGGLAFPLWRESHGGGDSSEYFHFTLSNGLFGLLSATLCFFVIGFTVLRALICRLVEPGEESAVDCAQIQRLSRRIPLYFAGCTAVPLLSVSMLSLGPGELLRGAFLALGIMGATGFALAYALSTVIRRDLRALQRALEGRAVGTGGRGGLPTSTQTTGG
jgi:serine/threonine protein kinase